MSTSYHVHFTQNSTCLPQKLVMTIGKGRIEEEGRACIITPWGKDPKKINEYEPILYAFLRLPLRHLKCSLQ